MKSSIKDRLKYFKYAHELADDSCVSDIYLVEYPKSGVTWLSTIIANYALLLSDMNETATFYNVSQYIPDIHTARRLGNKLYSSPPSRFIKSHAKWNPYYVHTVYLIRHPFNVMKSYYKFLQGSGVRLESFDKFLVHPVYGAVAWKRHVQSWLLNPSQTNHLHLMKYENMRENTLDSLKILLLNLGIQIDQQKLILAIEKSSLKNMRTTEAVYKENNPKYKLSFVGTGSIDFDDNCSEIEIIKDICGDEMIKVGYDI